MGGCASAMQPTVIDNSGERIKTGSNTRIQPSSLANLTDADLTLGAKIKEDELEQAVEKIFQKYDLDKDSTLSIDEIAALLKGSFKHNRDVTAKDAEEFILVLTGNSASKVERHHFVRWYSKIYC